MSREEQDEIHSRHEKCRKSDDKEFLKKVEDFYTIGNDSFWLGRGHVIETQNQ